MEKVHTIHMDMLQTLNAFGIVINKCCASCAYKDLTREMLQRCCKKTGKKVNPCGYCKKWAMSHQLQMAGRAQGQVKRKEYLMYLVAVREEETQAELKGIKIKPKSIASIRAEFEQEHGSIYLEDYAVDFRPFDQEW